MSVFQQIESFCINFYLSRGRRLPMVLGIPNDMFLELHEELKPMMLMPEPRDVHGELPDGSYGWRRETAEEYSQRINEVPREITLNLSDGSIRLIPSRSPDIYEVTL